MAMYPLTISEIVEATGGEYHGDVGKLSECITSVTHDSRNSGAGSLFVCIKGARADGHDFAPGVLAGGALCAVAERPLPGGCDYILVKSAMDALREIAAVYRKRISVPVVGIIGSVGKTTTKEMVSAVLSRRYNVLKTPANLNNELGVPMTLFSVSPEHTAAVIEMGISDFGEMSRLGYMVRPDIVVFTAIGYCHLERLGNLDGVLKAKSEVFSYMNGHGVAVMNGDDEKLRGYTPPVRKITYGTESDCDIIADNIISRGFDGISCRISAGCDRFYISIPAFGTHMVYAAMAAVGVGRELGLTAEEIIAGIGDYRTIDGRANLISIGNITVIDDCYNANPTSVSASLRSLAAGTGRKIAVLGDMKELTNAEKLHFDVGVLAGELGIDMLLTVGGLAADINRGFDSVSDNKSLNFNSNDELVTVLKQSLRPGDIVLVKASHSMNFTQIVNELKNA